MDNFLFKFGATVLAVAPKYYFSRLSLIFHTCACSLSKIRSNLHVCGRHFCHQIYGSTTGVNVLLKTSLKKSTLAERNVSENKQVYRYSSQSAAHQFIFFLIMRYLIGRDFLMCARTQMRFESFLLRLTTWFDQDSVGSIFSV